MATEFIVTIQHTFVYSTDDFKDVKMDEDIVNMLKLTDFNIEFNDLEGESIGSFYIKNMTPQENLLGLKEMRQLLYKNNYHICIENYNGSFVISTNKKYIYFSGHKADGCWFLKSGYLINHEIEKMFDYMIDVLTQVA